jgi:hypothetical protein
MGKGLQRIAALTLSATAALMAVGTIEVGALVGVSAPTVTTTVPQLTVTAPETSVTVPETSVTVPSTPVTPKTTVTTPTVKTPPPPAPKVSTPKVTTPKVPAPTGTSGSGSGSTTQKIVSGVTGTVGGGGGAGGGSPGGSASPTGTVTDALSTGTSALGSGSGGGSGGAGGASSGSSALRALGFFGGGSASGGTGGPAGPAGPGGAAGGQNVFAAGGRGGGLPPTLTAAQAKQLRAALSLLEGCMSAIAPLDRQVLAMRAGTGGTAPLARSQVAARLGVPARQVRLSERRGLSGLRTAAAQTGCAGAAGGPFSVAGIAMSPLLAFTPENLGGAAVAAAGGPGGYIAAREAGPGAESPLARLTDGGESGPAWLIVLVTVLFSVAVAALTRELRTSLGAPRY